MSEKVGQHGSGDCIFDVCVVKDDQRRFPAKLQSDLFLWGVLEDDLVSAELHLDHPSMTTTTWGRDTKFVAAAAMILFLYTW